LSDRLTRTEELIEDMHNNLNHRVPAAEIHRMVQDSVDNMWAVKMGNSDPIRVLWNKADELGNQVIREAEKTASVLTLQEEKTREIIAMREEHQKLLEQQAQSQQQVAEMQKELDANATFLRRVEEQMQQVLAQRQMSFQLLETTRSQIGVIAQEAITKDVEPAMVNFKFAVEGQIEGAHGRIYQMLWEKLEPSLQLTERIYQWFNSQIQK